MTDETRHWFAGIDWGSEKHQVCLVDAAGAVVGERAFAHGGAGLVAMCGWLVSLAGHPSTVAVAIEVPHGPVVDVLLDRGFAVHAINPKQLDRLRDRFSVAGAKDDRRDARVAAAGLRTDPHLFRPLQVGDPSVIELREWSRLAEELQQERLRLANRIRQQLWRYDPQLLALSDDLTAEWILELWSMASSGAWHPPRPRRRGCARRLREATLASLLRRHRIRRLEAASVLEVLRQPAITVAAGVTEAAVLHIHSLMARLRLANAEFCQAERKLNELCAGLSQDAAAAARGPCDADILRSLPGVGTVILATLLTEAGDPLARRDHAALRTLSGVAPVTKRSGKTRIVVMRYAAHVRLRQAVFHWARVAIVHDPKSRSRYEALRDRGHSYGRALRTVADRLLGLACVLLRHQVLFDPDHGAAKMA
jgi:transposase